MTQHKHDVFCELESISNGVLVHFESLVELPKFKGPRGMVGGHVLAVPAEFTVGQTTKYCATLDEIFETVKLAQSDQARILMLRKAGKITTELSSGLAEFLGDPAAP